MTRVLTLTTDLPYFPGRNGIDFFHLRHLAETHKVAVVGPSYPWYPQEGLSNLEAFLDGSYFWPRPARSTPLIRSESGHGKLPVWLRRSPQRLRRWLLEHLLGISGQPEDSYQKLALLSNCAPHLLEALTDRRWSAMVLIQTALEPWLDYLPSLGAKLVYFHDIRSDYLSRLPDGVAGRASDNEIAAIRRQEQRVTEWADVVAFVSELDVERARGMFRMSAEATTAPIPVDTRYFAPRPSGWQLAAQPTVLFTGHLSHPPNVDAVLYFLREIWPRVLAQVPEARFQVVGMMPAPRLTDAVGQSSRCSVHADVPDIRPFFWNAHLYVVPMRYGGGVRQKLFEAWSMRLPVVCTTMAAEGTGASHGVHGWFEDSSVSFANRVCRVLAEPTDESIVAAAKRHTELNNSIGAAAPRFQAAIERAIAIKKSRPFKVLFDLRWMELGKAGGIEQAAHELIATISRLDYRNAYRLLVPRSTGSEWKFPEGFRVEMTYSDPLERRAESLKAYLANRLATGLGWAPVMTPAVRSLAEYCKLDFDLVHSVSGYIHPDLIRFPNIVTINDLQHVHYPEFFSTPEVAERERLYREAASSAHQVICISEFTRQDVHKQYGIPLEKMTTVWIIPSRLAWKLVPEHRARRLLEGMGITGRFLFYPAHCWPHKNHARLLGAFELALSELPPDVQLVMTGRPFPEGHPAVDMMRRARMSNRAVHIGFRSPIEARALLQNCLALVFPSLFEGFGMPVAEAIIAGRPVICSNATSLPEIAGNAALMFDPCDVRQIARCIVEVASSLERRKALADAAAARRPLFSARKSAAQVIALYHRVHQDLYAG
jgi:glycosyltransferase involved in cell wall biosynthesis